jgi:sodium/potassium/calcium exchanger 6
MILGSVAETYLTPVLTKISEALGMSEAISGVTLLAFANGAPDILASISAAGEEDGIYIVVGNLFGACLFASTLVIGRCIGVCPKEIQMEPQFWNRDLIFYIVTLLMVILYGCIGRINLLFSLSFFAMYIVYLSVVIYVVVSNAAKLPAEEDRRRERPRHQQRAAGRRSAQTNEQNYQAFKPQG